MYDTILLPTDGSEAAENATRHAISLAEAYGATIHVLYVVDTAAIDVGLGTEQVQRISEGKFGEMEELEQRATAATTRVAEKALERGLEVEEAIAVGSPHEEIVEYATENDVDVIVMTSHGRSGVRRLLLGSVTEKVVRLAEIPVLVVDVSDRAAE